MQGGIHPDLPGTAYFDLAREVKRRRPGIHLHAFSPMEIVNGAARTGLSFRDFLTAAKEAGLDSIPGTAAEILDDDVRWVLTKGKLPTATWLEIVRTAHESGLPTTSTMMYGHVDTPAHWVAHLRTLAALQDETGGFTEFVLLPFVHHNSPIYLAGVARPGPTVRENRAVHAVARLLLHGRIPNIQTSWVKLADAGTQAVLQGGANDLGGTLMEETISRMAGSENGSLKTIAELEAMAAAIGRPARQRTTEYGTPSAERAGHRPLRRGPPPAHPLDHAGLELPRPSRVMSAPGRRLHVDERRTTTAGSATVIQSHHVTGGPGPSDRPPAADGRAPPRGAREPSATRDPTADRIGPGTPRRSVDQSTPSRRCSASGPRSVGGSPRSSVRTSSWTPAGPVDGRRALSARRYRRLTRRLRVGWLRAGRSRRRMPCAAPRDAVRDHRLDRVRGRHPPNSATRTSTVQC